MSRRAGCSLTIALVLIAALVGSWATIVVLTRIGYVPSPGDKITPLLLLPVGILTSPVGMLGAGVIIVICALVTWYSISKPIQVNEDPQELEPEMFQSTQDQHEAVIARIQKMNEIKHMKDK